MCQEGSNPSQQLMLEGKFFNNFSTKIRPERFKPSTIAHTGVNPLGAFHSFMVKDPIKNIDIRRDERPPLSCKKDFGFMEGKVPSGT